MDHNYHVRAVWSESGLTVDREEERECGYYTVLLQSMRYLDDGASEVTVKRLRQAVKETVRGE